MNRVDFVNRLYGGIGIELGVAKGKFSKVLCQSPLDKVWAIDSYSEKTHNTEEYKVAIKNNWEHHLSGKYHLLRGKFSEFVDLFEDNYFDFIYIDGYASSGQESGATLYQWWPKVKSGGVFAGHDYHDKYPLTVKAVDKFVADNNLKLNIISGLQSEFDFPSWYVIKG